MMAIPEQIDANSIDDYLEVMTKAVFQAGVSWAMVENKWPAFRKAFAEFRAREVSQFTQADIERLSNDASILRSRNKIVATIRNAQAMVALEDEYGDFRKYLRAKPDYKALCKDLQKRFKYMGDMNCYYFLFRVKESVPEFEGWIQTIEGHHPRMREMVELGLKKKS
jgi:3-methyladenine DNA glycosylase Tag